jgi:hypothetical protein
MALPRALPPAARRYDAGRTGTESPDHRSRTTGTSATKTAGVYPRTIASDGFEARTCNGVLRLLIGLDRIADVLRCWTARETERRTARECRARRRDGDECCSSQACKHCVELHGVALLWFGHQISVAASSRHRSMHGHGVRNECDLRHPDRHLRLEHAKGSCNIQTDAGSLDNHESPSSWPGLSRPSTSFLFVEAKTWMPGTRPGMTNYTGSDHRQANSRDASNSTDTHSQQIRAMRQAPHGPDR